MRKTAGCAAGIVMLALALAAAGPGTSGSEVGSASSPTTRTQFPSALYQEWRMSPAPADGAVARVNPPSLQWASVKYWERRDVLYRVELSDDPNFAAARTQSGKVQRWCFYNPHAKLKPGKWYWRYEIRDGKTATVKGPFAFEITSATPVFETPTVDQFMAAIPQSHPRVMTQGKDLSELRRSAATHPVFNDIARQGKKAAASAIYDGPVDAGDAASARALGRKASGEVRLFHNLLEAYVLSGDRELREVLLKRIAVMLKWPTSDLLGSQVLTALSTGYDVLCQGLPAETRASMLAVVDQQLRKGLAAWPGKIEGRQVENHFWQMELAGNFTAALATVHDLEASRQMLEYTYELFLARFPNLATPDGGWAEGFGYFGVNEAAVVDMALLLKKVGHVDVFKMQWYQTLADYYNYFAPLGGPIDGFGDMHDRVGNGDIGGKLMFVLGQENQDAKALFRAAQLMKSNRGLDPWYQIVNGVGFDLARVSPPAELPQSRMFRGVGLTAMHTDFLNSSHDTAVYFRSSPFGAKGHMHANQNAFNISHHGERLFYSSGYYTSFADPHSLSSYRHTRAANVILVNGCGQAFGHEGYGWIKRYAHGQDISYVCGDATMAYRPTVDGQFLGMLASNKIQPTPENGFGDARLKLFERHLLFVRPQTVIVYDVLDSEVLSDWTLLLHAMKKPRLDEHGAVLLDTDKTHASGFVTGSQPLAFDLTDRFYSPAVDILRKYREMPNQYHISYRSRSKSKSMRFLSVLQIADPGEKLSSVVDLGNGSFSVNGIKLHAELDTERPPCLSAESDSAKLYINKIPGEVFGQKTSAPGVASTFLAEKHQGKTSVIISENMPPEYPEY
jgi:hypothetical protein